MKVNYYILILVSTLTLSFFSSCKKNQEKTEGPEPEPTKTELITQEEWKITDIKMSPGITYGGLTFTDGGMFLEECVKDNKYTFNSDHTTTMNEGTTKCDSTAEQEIQEGTWEFNEDETKMIFSDSDFLGQLEMERLTTEELVLSRIETLPDTTITIPDYSSIVIPGGDQKLTITFKH